MQISLGDVVKMKKTHPCGSDQWTVTRTGADIKIRCSGCDHVVMMSRPDFEKRVKKILVHHEEDTDVEQKTQKEEE